MRPEGRVVRGESRVVRRGAAGLRAAPLLAPALLALTVFGFGPTLLSIFWGGTDKLLTGPSWHWTGLANFRTAIHDPAVQQATVNTLLYCAYTIVPAIVLGLGLALLVDRVRHGRPLVRVLLYLPVTANLVAMSVIFRYVFATDSTGLANTLLSVVGVKPIDWLGSSPASLLLVTAAGLWRLTSFVFVIYLAGLTALPRQVFEAADIDGIHGVARLRRITWPLLAPTTLLVSVLVTVLTLQTFETVAVLTQGGPAGSSEPFVYLIYLDGFAGSRRIGYASMLSFLLLVVVMTVGLLGTWGGRVARRRLDRSAA